MSKVELSKQTGTSTITLEEIQVKLEASSDFKNWSKEVGITFEDFDVIDLETERTIKKGKKDIGEYSIMIREENRLMATYDLTVLN